MSEAPSFSPGVQAQKTAAMFLARLGKDFVVTQKTGTALDHINRCRTWTVRDNHPIFVLFQITPAALCAVLKTTIEGGNNIKN